MKIHRHYALIFLLLICINGFSQPTTTPLRVIMIGAHPDDCDLKGGGTAILYTSLGHKVKFLSVTNGDAGHQSDKGKTLAARRKAEATEAGKRFGVEYDVLNNHDGLLTPSLEVRLQIIQKIREWNADIVIAPRPNDYHPDHRYTGVLVQDAAYLVAVPNIVPQTPALKKNPVFLYFQDFFQRPNPFRPDITIDISPVFQQKIHALNAHVSQFYEWLPWIGGYEKNVPTGQEERKKWLSTNRVFRITDEVRTTLNRWYGNSKGQQVLHAEAFEICEYGLQPDEGMIKKLFPMLGDQRTAN